MIPAETIVSATFWTLGVLGVVFVAGLIYFWPVLIVGIREQLERDAQDRAERRERRRKRLAS